jgi:hypothetical protein
VPAGVPEVVEEPVEEPVEVIETTTTTLAEAGSSGLECEKPEGDSFPWWQFALFGAFCYVLGAWRRAKNNDSEDGEIPAGEGDDAQEVTVEDATA